MNPLTEIERLWKSSDRKKEEPVTLSFDRFTVDGRPVCMAWYGSNDHARMACHFLGTSNFGTQYHCNLATVAHMSSLKNKSKCEFKRQIEIAQTACDWMRDMRVSPTNTRAAEIIGKTTVEEWSKTFTY